MLPNCKPHYLSPCQMQQFSMGFHRKSIVLQSIDTELSAEEIVSGYPFFRQKNSFISPNALLFCSFFDNAARLRNPLFYPFCQQETVMILVAAFPVYFLGAPVCPVHLQVHSRNSCLPAKLFNERQRCPAKPSTTPRFTEI